MQNFIVLGLIPGTQIQITFLMWLYAFSAVLLFLLRHRLRLVLREMYQYTQELRIALIIRAGRMPA